MRTNGLGTAALRFRRPWTSGPDRVRAFATAHAELLTAAAIAIFGAGVLLAQQPWDRWSQGDIALFQLFGRLVADGEVPYRDFFDHKTPLASYLNAVPALISRPFDVEYVLAARVMSVALAAAASVGLYFVARAASLGRATSAVAAVLFPAFDYHDYFAVLGIEPNLLNSYVGVFALLAAYRSRWLVAGVLCALAFLALQPGGVFLLGAGTIALMSGRARKAISLLVVGFVAPVAILLFYFGIVGALGDFWADTVTFNLDYVNRQFSWLPFDLMADRINSGHSSDRWLFLVGALGFAAWVGTLVSSFRRGVTSHAVPALPLAVVTVGVLGYSYVNFTTAADILPLIPWVAFWSAWLIDQLGRQPARWAPGAAAVSAVLLVGYGYHSLPDLVDIGNPTDEGAIVRGIEQRAHLQPGDPIFVADEAWYLLLSERHHLSRYYTLRGGQYQYAQDREGGTYKALLRPLIEEKPKLVVITRQKDWLTQSKWRPLQKVYGPILLWSYTLLDPATIPSGFARRADFWVLRDAQDFESPDTQMLDRWQASDAIFVQSEDGVLVTSDQPAYSAYERPATFPVPLARGAVYAGLVWVKGTDQSVGEMASITIHEQGGMQGESLAKFQLTADWQPVVVVHTIAQLVPEALSVHVLKQNGAGKEDSFLIREGQLRLLVPGLPK